MSALPNQSPVLALQQDPDPFQLVQDVLQSPLLHVALLACLGLVVSLWLALVVRAYTDAARRETTPAFWALLCFVLPFLGYLIYAVVRPAEYADEREERELRLWALRREARGGRPSAAPPDDVVVGGEAHYPCPSCEEPVAEDFLACPSCGEHLKDACGACSRPLEPEWILCPYCPDGGGRPIGRPTEPRRQEVPRPTVPLAEARDDGKHREGGVRGEIHAVRPNGPPNDSPNGRARLRDVRAT